MSRMITTGFGFEGYKIKDYCGVYSAEVLVAPSLRKQEEKWDISRQKVLDDLFAKIPENANAIIGVHFEHTGFCGNNYIIATGTAVSIELL